MVLDPSPPPLPAACSISSEETHDGDLKKRPVTKNYGRDLQTKNINPIQETLVYLQRFVLQHAASLSCPQAGSVLGPVDLLVLPPTYVNIYKFRCTCMYTFICI